jgi:enoyl-CoA hydratase/carnithine racemase
VASYETLCAERPEPAIVVARLDRPERLNAITFEMFDEFVRLQREVESNAAARVVVLTGTGRAFCAGLDLDEAALALENRNQVLATRTDDMVEALTAFREKRSPTYLGH